MQYLNGNNKYVKIFDKLLVYFSSDFKPEAQMTVCSRVGYY